MANYRLSIRKMEREDIPSLLAWTKNRTLTRHIHFPLPQNDNEGNKWFQLSLIDKTRDDYLIFVVDENGQKQAIGMLGIFNIDEANKKAEYFILIGHQEFVRRGIAFRTSGEILENCFKTFHYNKIVTFIDKEHYEAQRLAEKLGFRREGLLAEDARAEDGTFIDRFAYGLTAGQWQEK